MSVTGKIKEAAGYAEEEAGEKMNKDNLAQKGRNLRNEGRIEDNKAPLTTKPGTTGKKDEAEEEE